MAPSRRQPIAIGDMHVADVVPGGSKRVSKRGVLDVHVEHVWHKLHAFSPRCADDRQAFRAVVDEVDFVPIHRLHDQIHAEWLCHIGAALYAVEVAPARGLSRFAFVDQAAHAARVDLGAEFGCKPDHLDDAIYGLIANGWVRESEIQTISREDLSEEHTSELQ